MLGVPASHSALASKVALKMYRLRKGRADLSGDLSLGSGKKRPHRKAVLNSVSKIWNVFHYSLT